MQYLAGGRPPMTSVSAGWAVIHAAPDVDAARTAGQIRQAEAYPDPGAVDARRQGCFHGYDFVHLRRV
jgi:hypothetical protein